MAASMTPATSLAALMEAITRPQVRLRVARWDDDGLALLRIEITAGGHTVCFDAECSDLGGGNVSVGLPGLVESSRCALVEAGVLPEIWTPEALDAKARLETSIVESHWDTIIQAARMDDENAAA